ncbi:MAG TPA: isoprenylcysteine carboxylmethyltransferase family protein [Chthoniobacterales bacterium]
MSLAALLGFAYFASEVLLSISRRSRSKTGVSQDRSTLRALWIVIIVSVTLAVHAARHWRFAALSHHDLLDLAAIVLFVAGLAVRWWSIIVLGRFFTVDVTIEKDHQLIEAGPYQLVRHPSYTGVLLAFVGWGLSLHNWLSLVLLLVPIFIVFTHRMNVEEDALRGALGERYATYMRRTKRLFPFIY